MQTPSSNNLRTGEWTAGMKLADFGSAPKMIKAAGGAVWTPNGGAVTVALVNEAHALGLKVVPWTVNKPEDMHALIDKGVDGIITDYPERLREVMQARGIALPPPIADIVRAPPLRQ